MITEQVQKHIEKEIEEKIVDENNYYLGAGDDDTPPTESDTELGNEYNIDRISIQSYSFDEVNNELTIEFWISSTEWNDADGFKENAVFLDDSNGDMYARNTHDSLEKTTDIEYLFTYKFNWSVNIND